MKNMVGALAGNAAGDAGRDPASESGDIADGIGDRESTDLFERVHSFHERCQQKGCVAGLHRHKMGGA